MQKITAEGFAGIVAKVPVGKTKSEERKALESLKVGEGLVIQKREWKVKSTPSTVLGAVEGEFETKTLADGTGWAVLRVA